jgi:probable HAF family extracellular repeat protein
MFARITRRASAALARNLVPGLLLAFGCQVALAQAVYRITPLGYLGGCKSSAPSAAGLNGSGQVAGTACNAHGDMHAFLWKNDGTPMVDLGPSTAGVDSEGVAIDSRGGVAGDVQPKSGEYAFLIAVDGTRIATVHDDLGGSAVFPYDLNNRLMFTGAAYTKGDAALHAILWQPGVSQPTTDLGTLGGDSSVGVSINDSLQVTGSSDVAGNGTTHAFMWTPDSRIEDLGTLGGNFSNGLIINNAGQITGTSNVVDHGRGHAFFRPYIGPMRDLGTLGGGYSYPTGLNDAGQVSGNSYKSGPQTTHAFVWLNDGTPIKDLGTLGGTRSFANAINFSGQVTGSANLAGDVVVHAFLWRNDGSTLQDLNKLIDSTDPLKPYITLTAGHFINYSADIVADGLDSRTGQQDLYLLHGTVLTLTPRALAFGNQPIHSTSTAKLVTMTNTSATFVRVTSIALVGSARSQFSGTNNCGKGLLGHKSCTIQVLFKPTAKGAKTALLNVNGGDGGLLTVTLTGTGT